MDEKENKDIDLPIWKGTLKQNLRSLINQS